MGGTHQGFESALEVFIQVEPVPGVYLQSVEDRRQVSVDGAALALAKTASAPVHQLKIVLQAEPRQLDPFRYLTEILSSTRYCVR